jgi:hypothetical protein
MILCTLKVAGFAKAPNIVSEMFVDSVYRMYTNKKNNLSAQLLSHDHILKNRFFD